MTLGQQVNHQEFGLGTIQGIATNGLLNVLFEDGITRYVNPKHGNFLTLEGKTLPKTKNSNPALEIIPSALSDAFVEHCRVAGIAINLQSPEHDMERCRTILESLGISVPAGFRAIRFGTRGGTEQTQSFKLRAVTPLPANPSIIPSRFTIKDGRAVIFNTPVLLGLLIAGFPITSCNESE
jgi:hypothetical protein